MPKVDDNFSVISGSEHPVSNSYSPPRDRYVADNSLYTGDIPGAQVSDLKYLDRGKKKSNFEPGQVGGLHP